MSDAKVQQLLVDLKTKLKANNSAELRQIYDDWATNYDGDLKTLGYVAPQNGAALLVEKLGSASATVLDAGCGTGLVGFYLNHLGHKNIHGVDLSKDMMAVAAKLNIYQSFNQVDFTQPLTQIKSGSYDGVICVGVLGPRVPIPLLVGELLRIANTNGIVVLVVRDEWFAKVEGSIYELAEMGFARIVHNDTAPYFESNHTLGRYIAIRKVIA